MNTGRVIVGLLYGDEGKGLTTSFLCSQSPKPLVVRFNAGQQCGHCHVHKDGNRHVFSQFGSGTMQGVPTYFSSFCTFYPPSFYREYKLLKEYNPIFYINPLCPVTTPFDIDHNRNMEKRKAHGSVGMGFGATLQRQQDFYKLFVQDLFHEKVMIQKLRAIGHFYYNGIEVEEQIEEFVESVRKVRDIIKLSDDSIMQEYNPIFEGGQGILLDMDFGFFPNVTRSNTTSKNALSIYPASEIYYVTRTYLTRHGNGYMPNENKIKLVNNENETNKSHAYQGEFRIGELDTDLMNYALACDNNFSKHISKNLVITCMDQHPIDVESLLNSLDTTFDKVFISEGDSIDKITQIK